MTQELEDRAKMLKLKLNFRHPPDVGLPLSDSEIVGRQQRSSHSSSSSRRHGAGGGPGGGYSAAAAVERFESDPEAQTSSRQVLGSGGREPWTTQGRYGGSSAEYQRSVYGTSRGSVRSRSQEQRDGVPPDGYGGAGGGGGGMPEMRTHSRLQTILRRPDPGAFVYGNDGYPHGSRARGRDSPGDGGRVRRDRHRSMDGEFSDRRGCCSF